METNPRGSVGHASTRRRRKQRRRLVALSVGLGLTLATLLLVAFVFPPSFLSSSEQSRPSVSSGEPVPVIEEEPEVRIAIAGDTGLRNEAEYRTARRMELESEDDPYDALILLGDIIYPDGDSDLTRESVTIPFAKILEDATVLPALGNHDVQSDEEDEILAELGRDNEWYVEQVGPVRVITLDSNQVRNQRQLAWLREVLAEEEPPDTWTIASMHHPAYSAGEHGSTRSVQDLWVPLFEEADVPLVLAGHDHDYQRSAPINDITYVISGGGSKLRETGSEDFTEVSESVFHFVDLLVYDDRLEGRAIDHDGNLVDEFTIKR
ncbi:metallophosphoesterase family protein [Aeromicrobium sp.]|uniref:metallophosphoesterase family protein n=1 Tax=Aeromicrobium sp. TaxID=1871063 RepID=UPI003D6C4F5E